MKNLLYIHGQGCGGDSISLLNAEEPDFLSALEMLDLGILWHPSLSVAQGNEFRTLIADILSDRIEVDFLLMEGAIPRAPHRTGTSYSICGEPFMHIVQKLAAKAFYTLAVGTCATNGGIPGSQGNPTNACGLQFKREKGGGILGADYRARSGFPVINIPGCPAHPDWIVETLYMLVQNKLTLDMLDYAQRPAHFYNTLAHHACPKNEFYEFKASARAFGQQGCLFEILGCRGTQCESDCNIRLWLGRTGSCTRGGYPCVACTSQTFPLPKTRYFSTELIANVPRFLPADVPKAWYIGISGLSKMAMPERLKINAVTSHVKSSGQPRHGRTRINKDNNEEGT